MYSRTVPTFATPGATFSRGGTVVFDHQHLPGAGSIQGNQVGDVGSGLVYTGCTPQVGDANGDGVVDIADLLVVLDNWGSSGPDGDVNGDNIVDIQDLLAVIGNWS